MISQLKHELDTEYEQRVGKIREAASVAIKELDQLRSAGPVSRSAFEAGVAKVAQEKVSSYGCDLVVRWVNDGVVRFVIRVRRTGREYDLITSFYHRDNGR